MVGKTEAGKNRDSHAAIGKEGKDLHGSLAFGAGKHLDAVDSPQ
jgi:hypothetical protein